VAKKEAADAPSSQPRPRAQRLKRPVGWARFEDDEAARAYAAAGWLDEQAGAVDEPELAPGPAINITPNRSIQCLSSTPDI
jgi:hypothetical protein